MAKKRFSVIVTGIVQGVGFRPYVYKLANGLGLTGWVLNSPAGVECAIEGEEKACSAFLARLKAEAPSVSRIDGVSVSELCPLQETAFTILPSKSGPRRTLISPDLALCPDCLAELLDPADRRYRYPFINCTNCGPRFTIIEGLPYDRPLTTMKHFVMCDKCRAEYSDPAERRFHAQPNACAACGPTLRFLDAAGKELPGEPLQLAKAALKAGLVLAVKGLGGYHLACDAQNEQAVNTLRGRKLRWHKPFALMLPDAEQTRRYCELNPQEEELLTSPAHPIVLLKRKKDAPCIPSAIAPDSSRLGVMLPYTPLHHLLCLGQLALVMTSANFSDEPIAYKDPDALTRLSGLADAFLLHDRPIFRRADDSVAIWAAGSSRLIRRSRGYAPQPLRLSGCKRQILAVGSQEKNTFCLTRGPEAILSQHIGDLDDVATYAQYRREIEHFCDMFKVRPEAVACDLHPDYLSTRYARQSGLPLLKVQHHHAHLASVLAEYGLNGPALGFIFDGSGYGPDGNLWGGEILYGDTAGFTRRAHLAYLPLPGGEKAIREPWRQALSALYAAGGEELAANSRWGWPAGWEITLRVLKQEVNAPLSSGMGRLFDALAALCGLYHKVSYEGQAAIALENIIDDTVSGCYGFAVEKRAEGPLILDWRPVIRAAAQDLLLGEQVKTVATRFHRAISGLCLELALRFKTELGAETVALSGGCWQNIWLLDSVWQELSAAGFKVYSNSAVPAGDGGLAYGQAAVAASMPEP
ncbi:MAG: carbamoyltransferase HypF [Clostridiales bacterium]|nr:carbamoyltransferase HypF [Clostridiales bacterium]